MVSILCVGLPETAAVQGKKGHATNLNFLIFVVDAMRASWLGCAGHRLVKTPHLDALAARGVRFERAYCNHPICMPARATLLTGLMPRDHGVWSNGMEIHPRIPTLPQRLLAAGYRTASVGKLHYSRWIPDPETPTVRTESLPGWNDGGITQVPLPYYGFEHVDMVGGHGDFVFGPYRHWLAEQSPKATRLLTPQGAREPPSGTPWCWKMGLPEEWHYNRWIADRTIAYLQGATTAAAPWFVWCSFPDPHMPFAPPAPYCDWYRPEDVAPPVRADDELDRLPPFYKAMFEGRMDSFGCPGGPLPDRAWQEMTALSLGMVSHVDAEIGRVLQALDQSGQRENTTVLFLSDHGSDLLGDHWMRSFGSFAFEQAVRIPLIVSAPGTRRGVVERGLVSQIDVVPTVLDLAGVSLPNGNAKGSGDEPRHAQCAPIRTVPGRSLGPVLRGGSVVDPLRSVLIENEEPFLGLNSRTLVTVRYKLTVYGGQTFGELFDLESDPQELRNLWDEPGAATLKTRLLQGVLERELDLFAWQPLPRATA